MPEPTSGIPPMDLSNLTDLANMIAKIVSDQVSSGIEMFHYKIAGIIIGSLTSALVYMYLTQRADKNDTYNKLFSVIADSTKTMEAVTNSVKSSIESEKRVEESVSKLQAIVRGCKGRNTTNDDEIDQ